MYDMKFIKNIVFTNFLITYLIIQFACNTCVQAKPSNNFSKGSLSVYFFNANSVSGTVDITIVNSETKKILITEKVKEGSFSVDIPIGDYKLKYKYNHKLSHTEKFSIYENSQTQVIVSFENHEYKVNIEHPQTMIFDAEAINPKKSEFAGESNRSIVLKGKVVDINNYKPIDKVNILAGQSNISTVTDKEGKFTLTIPEHKIKKSKIELSFIHGEYSTSTQYIDWPLKYGAPEITLKPSGISLDAMTVVAPHVKGSLSSMMNQRKTSMSVKDLLGADQISKSGDSNAASALSRVTGLSLVNGKFIYVRGLGERYSSTLLNGSLLPSPDPSRRVVPLDMFPTSIIESLEVQKTYSSDQLTEFGGGVVNITTKTIPDKFYAKVGVNTGVSSEDVLSGSQKGLFHSSSDSDWLGYDRDGIRKLPAAIQQAITQDRDLNDIIDDDPFASSTGKSKGFTGEEIQTLGRSFAKNYDVKEKSLPVNFGSNFEIGDQHKRGNIYKIGATAKLAYRNSTDTDNITQQRVDIGTGQQGVIAQIDKNTETENTINIGGIFGLGLDILKNHKFSMTQVLTRSTLNSTVQIQRDGLNNVDDSANIYRLRWQERELRSNQLTGNHYFNSSGKGPKINWSFTNSQASLDEPDFREYYYLNTPSGLQFADDKAYGNQRSFSELTEDLADFKITFDSQARLKTSKNLFMDVALKVGFQRISKDREFSVRRFKFRNESTSNSSLSFDRSDQPNQILADENIRPGGFRLSESTLPTDNYFADQSINALFVQASNTFNLRYQNSQGYDYLKPQIVYGLRLERSNQNVNTFDLSSKNAPVTTNLQTNDLLPSLGFNLALSSKHNLRFGFTKTLSRPDFKELSPARFLNDIDNIYERGNPDLVAAAIINYDFRWEWFPTSKELISVGFFIKEFENPIEAYAVNSTEEVRSYRNINGAQNSGIELEVRKDITEFIGSGFNTEIFSNYSLIASEVSLSPTEKGDSTNATRPLQGQSPYLLNFGIDLTLPKYDMNTTLVYNVSGKRITDVGDGGRQDIYELPVHQLDLSLMQKIKKNLQLTFRAQNILDPEVTRTQGDFMVSTFKRGRAFNMGLAAVF